MMRTKPAALAILTLLAAALPAAIVAGPVQQKQSPSGKQLPRPGPGEKTASATGCVDEQDGQYVLVDSHSLERVADLEADGFPREGFAKHVGHKVIVRGTQIANGARPLFKVRTVETVSETCAPQPPQQGKQ
jgi:hypothetical protein